MKLKNGQFSAAVDLKAGREYQFRYCLDENWENDLSADKYIPTPFWSRQLGCCY